MSLIDELRAVAGGHRRLRWRAADEIEEQSKHLESLQNRFAQCTAKNEKLTAEIELYRSYLQAMADMSDELAFNANGEWFVKVARKALAKEPLPTGRHGQ